MSLEGGGIGGIRSQKGGTGLSYGGCESRRHSVGTVEPLKGLESGDKMFGKIDLTNTVQGGDDANIPEHGPWVPSCSL